MYETEIVLLTVRPSPGAPVKVPAIEARNAIAAARMAAMKAAKALYGDKGQPSFFVWRNGELRVNIGEYHGGGLTIGVTAIIRPKLVNNEKIL